MTMALQDRSPRRIASSSVHGRERGLVGRAQELDRLGAALDDALAGRGRLVTIVGPAGIGKTRLAVELGIVARAGGAYVTFVACDAGAPLGWAWRTALRCLPVVSYDDAARNTVRDAVDALTHADPEPSFATLDRVAGALRAATSHHPLVVVLDDVHVADAFTMRMLDFVARQLAHLPLLVLTVQREDATAAIDETPGFDWLRVQPLAPKEIRALALVEAGMSLPEPVLDQIVLVSDGCPRSVQHAIRQLEDSGLLDRTTKTWHGPTWDDTLAMQRLAVVRRAPASASRTEQHVFRRSGDAWTVSFAGVEVSVADTKGMHYLRELLLRPGQYVHVLELVGGASTPAGRDPLLDATAKRTYRARLRELDAELADADARNDVGARERARHERDAITDVLAEALGLGGSDRTPGTAGERARMAVRHRVTDAIRRLGRIHPALAEHLRAHIRTGYWCVYQPGTHRPRSWTV
jgi:AAA ATPase-like protein